MATVIDLRRKKESFSEAMVAGLTSPRKSISAKFLYDEAGSALFERICALEEYYPYRTELGVLQRNAREIADHIGEGSVIVEFGSGSSAKTRTLLDQVSNRAIYVPIDISKEMLAESSERIGRSYPGLRLVPLCADFNDAPALIEALSGVPGRRCGFFPGSTIGNFEVADARAFLSNCARILGPAGRIIIGVDLIKDVEVLEAAYNDSQGVTAAFNLNLLRRMNRELRAGFDLSAFRHHAFFNSAQSRIEMHLISLRRQEVEVGGVGVMFRQGESIHTESSYKYAPARFEQLALSSGFEPVKVWSDPRGYFGVYCLAVRGVAKPVAA